MKHKQSLLISLVLLALPGGLCAQPWSGIVAPSRATDWTQAGVVGGIPNRTTICSTLSSGASASQINTAIANCPSGQVVKLNAGTYNLSAGIVFNNKSDVTLRGAGANQTFLKFTGAASCAGWGGADVCLMSADTGDGGDANYSNTATWTADYTVGKTSITLGSITKGSINNLQVGSIIFLDQLDDSSDTGQVYVCQASGVCSLEGGSLNGRAGRGQQQPVRVTSISGSGPWTIGISPGIRMPNISSGKSPQAWWDTGLPIQNDGIEDLSMDHTNTTAVTGTFMLNAYNCWVKNVRDIRSQHKHVWMYQSTHITIRDSFFYASWNSSSESYGTDTYNGADNLVENNIFQHIAIPVINEGCVGCVGSYNFAIDDFYDGTPAGSAPEWQQASSYHHSVGDAFLLWEGNSGIGMTSDNVHGTSNFFTAFRNYWNGRDPSITGGVQKSLQTNAIILNDFSRYYNIIGNVLGTAGYHNNYQAVAPSGTNCNTSIYALSWGGNCQSGTLANDSLTANTLMRWGNYDTVNGAVRWVSSEVPSGLSLYANSVPASQSLPGSFYLSAKPSWWGSVQWPAIGPDVNGGTGPGGKAYSIPAQVCYNNTPLDSSGILAFNASNCYGSGAPPPPTGPAAPTNLTVSVQ